MGIFTIPRRFIKQMIKQCKIGELDIIGLAVQLIDNLVEGGEEESTTQEMFIQYLEYMCWKYKRQMDEQIRSN